MRYLDLLNKLKFEITQYLRQFGRYKNDRPNFKNLKTGRFRYEMFKLEYYNNYVFMIKMPHGSMTT